MSIPYDSFKSLLVAALFVLQLSSVSVAQEKATEPATTSETKQEKSVERLLEWNNGNVLPGKLVKGSADDLFWISDLFDGQLQIDLEALNNVKFPRDETQRSTTEPYFVRTRSGDKLYGSIDQIDEDGLVLNSQRHGKLSIHRDQISKIAHMDNSGYILMGFSDLEDWGSLKRTKKHWKITDSGDLEATKQDINLFLQTDLPDAVQIDLVLKWEKNLNMVLGFGVPTSAKNLDKVTKIESWDDALVVNEGENFSVIYESVDDKPNRLAIQIQWDRKTNVVLIRDEQGKELCTANVAESDRGIKPGIYLENKKGQMKIETLRISKTAAGYDPSKPGIQLTDGSIVYGDIVSFDGDVWNIKEPDADESTQIPSDQFRTALVDTTDQETDASVNTMIRFQDGALLSGTLKSIGKNQAIVQTQFSDESVTSSLDGISIIRFLGEDDGEALTGRHTLYSSRGELFGEVFAGSGKDSDVIRWRPVGCKTGLPLTNGDTRISLTPSEGIKPQKESEWPDTIYFVNKDTIPCRIVSIDEENVKFESFAENNTVAQEMIKAVDFSAIRVSGNISCNDPGWFFSDKAKENIEVPSDQEMIVRGSGRFGHNSLSTMGKLKFDLEWKSGNYNVLECRSFVRNAKNAAGGLGVSIMLWDNMVMISDAGQNQMVANSQVGTPKNKAKVEITIEGGKMLLRINGKRAYSKKIQKKALKGSAVSFNLSNMNGNARPQVTISNIAIDQDASGATPIFIDEEKKAQLLTIPRLRKDNPPKHILCARNSDFLRGELTSMDGQRIRFQSRLDDFTFDREVVSSIVWLHAKTPNQLKREKEAAEEAKTEVNVEAETESQVQVVQIIMNGGQRLTVDAKLWSDTTFNGISRTLGACSIPIDDIRELRLGKSATEATDVAYADWTPKAALEPQMDDGSGSDASTFGKTSPLIGKKAEDFTMKMLDGSTFKLSEQRGKVIVLDFWATWCGPCVRALPDMIRATDRFDPDKVVFIAVNQLEEPELIKLFVKRREMDMKVGLDNGDIGDMFEVTSIPQTVIIDRDGTIAFLKVGSEADLESKMGKAIDDVLGLTPPENPGEDAVNQNQMP